MRAEESSSKPKKVMQEVGPSRLDSTRGTHNLLHASFFFFQVLIALRGIWGAPSDVVI